MTASFKGKSIWLVGASVGIGEALAHRLAASGAQLCLSARSADKLEHLRASLPGDGHTSVPLDVTDTQSVREAWSTVKSRHTIDLLIYNAGAYEPMNATAFNFEKIENMVDVNFRGSLRVLDCILPFFLEKKSGHIVLVASVAGYRGLPNAIGYGASKAALLHLAENLRLDLRKQNIKVQVVNPGFVKTRLTEKNAFNMPFIMTPEAAAERIERGMISTTFDINFPKRLSWSLKILRCLPYALYFRLLKNV